MIQQIVNLLLDLIAAITRKRKGKSHGAPIEVAEASEALAKAGVHDGLVSHTRVYDCKSGHAFDVWEVGRWGHDESRTDVLGRGATLGQALHEWERGQVAVSRRRWTTARVK